MQSHNLRQGITTLLTGTNTCTQISPSPCQDSRILDRLTNEAEQLHHELTQLVNQQIQTQPEMTYSYQSSHTDLYFYERTDFKFPSLIQRPSQHPSNQVHGIYFTPRPYLGCQLHYPTLVVIHESVDDIDQGEVTLAQTLVGSTQSVAVLIVYLPHYGPRRLWDANSKVPRSRGVNFDYLTPDMDALKLNIKQTMLDLHLAFDWLNQQKSVDRQRIYTFSPSLGAFLDFLYTSLDPSRVTGGHFLLVGGGDLSSIARHHIETDPTDEVSQRLRHSGWSEAKARLDLAAIDPITWASHMHHQNLLLLSAVHDELIDPQSSLQKLLGQIDSSNTLKHEWLDTGHNPYESANLLYLFTHILMPLEWYLLEDVPRPLPRYQCTKSREVKSTPPAQTREPKLAHSRSGSS